MGDSNGLPDLSDPRVNANDLISWLEKQNESSLSFHSETLYEKLLAGASQPRHSSVLACTKLCGLLQHCTKSDNAAVRRWVFSEPTAMRLFNFYIEWNEKDQHRSMRLVLDLLTVLIGQNPDAQTGSLIRSQILVSLVSIITRHSTRPLVKSCINSLNHLLGKSVYDIDDIGRTYRGVEPAVSTLPELELWRRFCNDLVSWMYLHYVCSVAGKLLVTILKALRERAQTMSSEDGGGLKGFGVHTWQEWLQDELYANPSILENIKLYVFVPLFKTDRPGSLELLQILNQPTQPEGTSYGENVGDSDDPAVLRLAALEVGKKAGLVEDPGSQTRERTSKPSKAVVLDVQMMESVLVHPSPAIRLLALSLLVTSPSSSKPYPKEALSLIRKHLPSYHSDPGAGFRQEALVYAKVMVKRIKGTIASGQQQQQQQHQNAPPLKEAKGSPALSETTQVPLKNKERLPEEILKEHESFFKWYLDFLLAELVPTASYQRHITALKATLQVLQFGKETVNPETLSSPPGSFIFGDYSWIRSILDLVIDPFSDVRETAIALLMLAPQESVEAQVGVGLGVQPVKLVDIVRDFRSRASVLASRTGRADHGDGSARLQGLLCSWSSSLDQRLELVNRSLEDIQAKLDVAKRDIARAVIEYPVHGDFASISCIWDVLTRTKYSTNELDRLISVQQRIVDYSRQIWDIVKPILCDDSPEGHLPREMEDAEGLDTKGLLSYSFRAVHESSNTMRLMVAPLRFSRVRGTLCPSREVFTDIGALTFEQLSSLRHRGAFSTVSLTFTTCCQLVEDPVVTAPRAAARGEETLLLSWYRGTLDCIHAQTSTTRRSAGIPALMTAILAANAARPSFDEVVGELGRIARRPARASETDGTNLPQVHALNCVKDVMKSSLLSSRAERYLPSFLQVAADSLRSEVWAVRNCGLLLLRSVIDCLLGNSDSKAVLEAGWDGRAVRISYVKYPTLPAILVSLLRPGRGGDSGQGQDQDRDQDRDPELQRRAAESVFPALDIIRRAGPPDSHRAQLYALVRGYLASHLWHVREMAARTVSSFLLSMDWLGEIRGMLEESQGSANRLHGSLLTVKFLLEKGREGAGAAGHGGRFDDADTLAQLESVLEGVVDQKLLQVCPEIQAIHLETLSLLTSLAVSSGIISGTPCTSLCCDDDALAASPALLQVQLSLEAVQRTAMTRDVESLRRELIKVSLQDSNAASQMLESIPTAWDTEASPEVSVDLCGVYMDVLRRVSDTEVRVSALDNLTEVLDRLLLLLPEMGLSRRRGVLPAGRDLLTVWEDMHSRGANPAVFHASLRFSGPVMAILSLEAGGVNEQSGGIHRKLRSWAVMVSEAGHSDNPFDTREAAAQAMKSFIAATGPPRVSPPQTSYTPLLLTLYDILNDDDDEIRDLGAAAASHVLGGSSSHGGCGGSARSPSAAAVAPLPAAERLLAFMEREFSNSDEFQAYTVLRSIGESKVHMDISNSSSSSGGNLAGALDRITPPDGQLRRAMAFDDALFVVEEQNLFIDEVRETRRWTALLAALPWSSSTSSRCGGEGMISQAAGPLAILRSWTRRGLEAMTNSSLSEDDGGGVGVGGGGAASLGEASSQPAVFDVCSRIILNAVALVRLDRAGSGHGDETGSLERSLLEGKEVWERAGLHGSLLQMAGWVERDHHL